MASAISTPPADPAGSAAEPGSTFAQILIRHPKLAAVDAEVTSLWPLHRTRPEDLTHVLVYGPTGSGKSAWGQRQVATHPRRVEAERTVVPVVWFRIPLPFSWKECYIQALVAGYGAPAPTDAAWMRDDLAAPRLERATEGALKRRVVELASRTDTRVWIVDEIQHLAYARGPLLAQLEHLKHLADEAGVMLILTGTYDALALVGLNGQLTRRVRPLLLDRYRTFTGDLRDPDTRDFARLVQALDARLPLPERSDLVTEAPRLHRTTLGLVGLLKPLLVRSLDLARRQGRSRITADLLERCRLPTRQLAALARELTTDEARDAVMATEFEEPGVTRAPRPDVHLHVGPGRASPRGGR